MLKWIHYVGCSDDMGDKTVASHPLVRLVAPHVKWLCSSGVYVSTFTYNIISCDNNSRCYML